MRLSTKVCERCAKIVITMRESRFKCPYCKKMNGYTPKWMLRAVERKKKKLLKSNNTSDE